MKIKLMAVLASLLLLGGCASDLVIQDGQKTMLIGNDRVKSGCEVRVDEDFDATVIYKSEDGCDFKILKGELIDQAGETAVDINSNGDAAE